MEIGDLVFSYILGHSPRPVCVMGQANGFGKFSLLFFGTDLGEKLKQKDIHQYGPENVSK